MNEDRAERRPERVTQLAVSRRAHRMQHEEEERTARSLWRGCGLPDNLGLTWGNLLGTGGPQKYKGVSLCGLQGQRTSSAPPPLTRTVLVSLFSSCLFRSIRNRQTDHVGRQLKLGCSLAPQPSRQGHLGEASGHALSLCLVAPHPPHPTCPPSSELHVPPKRSSPSNTTTYTFFI